MSRQSQQAMGFLQCPLDREGKQTAVILHPSACTQIAASMGLSDGQVQAVLGQRQVYLRTLGALRRRRRELVALMQVCRLRSLSRACMCRPKIPWHVDACLSSTLHVRASSQLEVKQRAYALDSPLSVSACQR